MGRATDSEVRAYWAEPQRPNEFLLEDLLYPLGWGSRHAGTARSVLPSMPPNEMHEMILLTICILQLGATGIREELHSIPPKRLGSFSQLSTDVEHNMRCLEMFRI